MTDPIYDVLTVGLGPANLALAVALEDEAERPGGHNLRRVFLEARESYSWHPEMLIEGSQLQINVLKDLVMVSNPRSRFTFLNYLHEQGRLFHFLNLRNLFPSRREFNLYLTWVAQQLGEHVRYGRRVRSIEPVAGQAGLVDVVVDVIVDGSPSGAPETYRTRNVVIATGPTPVGPAGVDLPGPAGWTNRVFHSHEFLKRIKAGFPEREAKYRFLVVGSGQSGAEIFHHLMNRYPNADVTQTVRGFGYKPVDESDFTNEVFFPHWRDFFYHLPEGQRQQVIDQFRDVNYAVVDHPLIQRIYRQLYDEMATTGRERARLVRYQQLTGVEQTADRVNAHFVHVVNGERQTLTVDGLVICTGYKWLRDHPLLRGLGDVFVRDGEGRPRLARDYRLENQGELTAGVYLQSYGEDSHGISETVLSLVSVRAREIVDSVLSRRDV